MALAHWAFTGNWFAFWGSWFLLQPPGVLTVGWNILYLLVWIQLLSGFHLAPMAWALGTVPWKYRVFFNWSHCYLLASTYSLEALQHADCFLGQFPCAGLVLSPGSWFFLTSLPTLPDGVAEGGFNFSSPAWSVSHFGTGRSRSQIFVLVSDLITMGCAPVNDRPWRW